MMKPYVCKTCGATGESNSRGKPRQFCDEHSVSVKHSKKKRLTTITEVPAVPDVAVTNDSIDES